MKLTSFVRYADLQKIHVAGGRRERLELLRRVKFHDRRMGRRRLEVLTDGQQAASGPSQVGERPQDVLFALPEADHQAGLGQGAPFFRGRQEVQGPAVILPGAADRGIEGFRRLQVVVEDVRGGLEDPLERRQVAAEIRDERFDPGSRTPRADRPDDRREMGRAAVGEVVPRHRRDHGIGQPERGDRPGDMDGLVRVRGQRMSLGHGAEAAVPGARVAEDEERRRLAFPTGPDVRTPGALADGVQSSGLDDFRDTEEVPVGRKSDLQPDGFLSRRGYPSLAMDLALRVAVLRIGTKLGLRRDESSQYSMSRSLLMRRLIRFRAWASFIRRFSPGLK